MTIIKELNWSDFMNLRDFMSLYQGDNLITIYEDDYICFENMVSADIFDSLEFKKIAENKVVKFDILGGAVIIYTIECNEQMILHFEFSEDKIHENTPDLKIIDCYKMLDKICDDSNFNKIEKGIYNLKNGEDDIGALLVLVSRLKKQSWLIQNLNYFKVIDEDGEQDALKFILEDL